MTSTKVFVAGSRAVSRLNDTIRARLDHLIAREHDVLIGDANGADRMVQRYLADHGFRNVNVFCTGGTCRNNVGDWPQVSVAPPAGIHSGFEFYSAKDREMASHATHGLMLWDGESRGTFANIRNLITGKKPVVVYLSPIKQFVNVRTLEDLSALVARVDRRVTSSSPATLQVRLAESAVSLLRRKVNGRGGFQQLLRKLQGQLKGSVLTIDPDDAEKLARYSTAYGLGGFQERSAPSSYEVQQVLCFEPQLSLSD